MLVRFERVGGGVSFSEDIGFDFKSKNYWNV